MIFNTIAAGTLLRRYAHGEDSDDPLVWYEGAGTGDRRFLTADERGSIMSVTGIVGTPIATNAYDAFGIPAKTNIGRFGYTGQIWLPEVGLWYYKARMYSPTTGRFMQSDPIGMAGGVNLYAYAENDPVNYTDPSGLIRTIGACVVLGGPSTTNSANEIVVSAILICPEVVDRGPVDTIGTNEGGGGGGTNKTEVTPKTQNPKDGDTRCLANVKQFADQLGNVGNGIQNVGKIMTGVGLAGDLAATLFPPAELVTGGFTALGGAVTALGNGISGAGSVLDFVATGNYQRAGLNAVGFVAGRLSSTGEAHNFARGVVLDAAVNGKLNQMQTSCSPGK